MKKPKMEGEGKEEEEEERVVEEHVNGGINGDAAGTATKPEEEEDEYFKAYFDLEVHKLMLGDVPRTCSYRDALAACAEEHIRGKVVMDVGAGTGILSLFCFRAGAKKVFAVEASHMGAKGGPLQRVVEANGASDVVKVVHGRAEEVDLPEEVDVVVSEWMGFYLLHESMLESVIMARDKHLKEDGIVLPSHASVWCAPCGRDEAVKEFDWGDVYGFDMAAMREYEGVARSAEPKIECIAEDRLLTEPRLLEEFDLRWVETSDLQSLEGKFFASAVKGGRAESLAIWFDCSFQPSSVQLRTGPGAPDTHWKQTLVPLMPSRVSKEEDDGDELDMEEGDVVAWRLEISKSSPEDEECRRYNISVGMLDAATEEHPTPCQCGWAKCELIKALLQKQEEEDDEEDVEDIT